MIRAMPKGGYNPQARHRRARDAAFQERAQRQAEATARMEASRRPRVSPALTAARRHAPSPDWSGWSRENGYAHAKVRARERYGVEIDRGAYETLNDHIRAALAVGDETRARLIVAAPAMRSFWLVRHSRAGWMLAVWHQKRDRIATFLPLHVQFDDRGRTIDRSHAT